MTIHPLRFVDSHCHLNFPELHSRLDDVMEKAKNHDIAYMMTVNTRLDQTEDLIDITARYAHVFCTVGLHPNDTNPLDEDYLVEHLQRYAAHSKVVGFGETGLDYYYEHSDRQIQKKAFHHHLEASTTYHLPVIIHTRSADEDTLAIIKEHPTVQGVFHCFSGSRAFAKQALDLGFLISFSGIITFKKAEELRDVVAYVPLDRLLIETDAPYLAPVPHRGSSNEPAYTRFVAEKVAEIKGITLNEVGDQTTKNYFDLFQKAKQMIDTQGIE